MKIFSAIFLLTLTVAVKSQLAQQPQSAQQAKPQSEPLPHSEHSPGNPPSAVATNTVQAQNPNPSVNANSNVNPNPSAVSTANANATNLAGNVLTNVAIPKAENAPVPGAEPKPKSEPKPEPNGDHDHEHSPGNPKHLASDGHSGSEGIQATRLLFIFALIMPFILTFLTSGL